jgi:hypothetical protein
MKSVPSSNAINAHSIIIFSPSTKVKKRNLSMHSIQAALQLLLQAHSAMTIRLLRSWIFGTPASAALWDGHCWTLTRALLTRLDTHMLSKSMDLFQNHLAHLAYILNYFKVKVEGCRTAGLVGGVVPDVEVWVLERGLDGDSG